ncbi:hypothetical protein FACS1894111_10220 [Clostridia bacterium]|nr:hypothetical protein FACS1894111_10220 [Clostridia bacterium]
MKKYIITTDNTADLPASYLTEHEIATISLSYILDGETYGNGKDLSCKEFYDKMRSGALPTTSQVNPTIAKEFFSALIAKEDADILHISFSSGLSGTYNSLRIAAEELTEEDSNHTVIVIDSLAASLGEGLLVHSALKNRQNGMSLQENADWLLANRLHVVHNFTVDDLHHLARGGRISKTAATLGTLVSIKPLLHVNEEGQLEPVDKVRGRKKALKGLVYAMEQQLGSFRNQNEIIWISHADAPEDAQYVADSIKEHLGFTDFIIGEVSPTVGAHSGPGTIALIYLGEKR